jgi:hypothetical protein
MSEDDFRPVVWSEMLEIDEIDDWLERIRWLMCAEPQPAKMVQTYDPSEPHKTCEICERDKPLSMFPRQHNTADGRSHRCLNCFSLQNHRRYEIAMPLKKGSSKDHYPKYPNRNRRRTTTKTSHRHRHAIRRQKPQRPKIANGRPRAAP